MNTENYPTWLIPLEIAKELKEIEFNEPCNHYVRISNDDIKLKINHSSIVRNVHSTTWILRKGTRLATLQRSTRKHEKDW